MTNGNRSQFLMAIITSVVVASVMSVASTIVSVQVMSNDLDRAKTDIADTERLALKVDRDVAQIEAAKIESRNREDERWDEVRRRLVSIEGRQDEILRAIPRWRTSSGR